ncbi:sigma factor [Nonomuraea maritima]|uniref:sigma factor n=1 Tax=Nonomuraea maritima TaxID=683260 RepID=UPI00371DF20C
MSERRLMSEVAELLLSSAQDAECVVREAYVRWYAMPEDLQDEVDSPTAWLISVVSRLCCERLNEAPVRPQLATARPHPGRCTPRGAPAAARTPAYQDDRIVQVFKKACARTDKVDRLTALLAPDVTVITDGGGRVRAPLQPITGVEPAARFLVGLFGGQADVTVTEASINSGPGLVVRVAGTTAAVVVLHVRDGLVQDVWIVMNPDKLRAWHEREDPPADATRTR